MAMSEHRAAKVLREYPRELKQRWRGMGRSMEMHRASGHEWPSWCLLPKSMWPEALGGTSMVETPGSVTADEISAVALYGSLGLWRLSKGVYGFSDTMATEISATELPGNIPTDVFRRLPEWCIYLDLVGVGFPEEFRDLYGAWIHINYEKEQWHESLVVVLDMGEASTPLLYPMSGGSVLKMVEGCMGSILKSFEELGPEYLARNPEVDKALAKSYGSVDSHVEMISTILKLLLYICSSEPDIEDHEETDAKPTRARMQRMGKRDMFVAADRVRIWNVGDKVGEMIRNYNEDPADRKHTRRHLRRAHWHGYWTGKRDSDEREFSYKWLSPMVVGVSA